MAAIEISCAQDIATYFSRNQHYLEPTFRELKTIRGAWEGMIRNGGQFPTGTGFRARVSTLGSERMDPADMQWVAMVGLQDDCVTSCNVPSQEVNIGNADHRWYGVFSHGQYTTPFCLEKMWADSINLPQQIRNRMMNLKQRTVDVMDEFYRKNTLGYADHRWAGNSSTGEVTDGGWNFEYDANGEVNIDKIIITDDSLLGAGGTPVNIGLPSLDAMNYIKEYGSYDGAFELDGPTTAMVDMEIAQQLPKFDTNVRADNRYRQPTVLNPGLNTVDEYGGFRFRRDPFIVRYYWDVDDPNYPDGVLTRIKQWSKRRVSEGCVSTVSTDYLKADFTVIIFPNEEVWEWQNYETPNPPEMPFEQPFSPYNGIWHFRNQIDEITPCNRQKNLAYWEMILKKAAKPNLTSMGHVYLVRRYNSRGVFASCRGLTVPTGGSYDCSLSCPPIDATPPAYVSRVVCAGKYNPAGANCGV